MRELIVELAGIGPLKVWSVLVTIMGDLTHHREEAVSTSLLLALTDRMGLRAEAVRVALHRLGKDGWLTAKREGRISRYRFTPHGLAESHAARSRIYPSGEPPTGYRLAIANRCAPAERALRDEEMRMAGFIPITPDLYIGPEGASAQWPGLVMVDGPDEQVPAWMAALAGEGSEAGYAGLWAALQRLRPALDGLDDLDDLNSAALRVLVIHHWRRQVLRHPNLPRRCFPEAWRGHECRALVQQLLKRLPRRDPAELEAVVSGGA